MEFKILFVDDHFDVKLSGKASTDDCRKYFDRLISHEKWQPGSLVLSDETELEVGHLSADDIKMMATISREKMDAIGATRFAAYVNADFVYAMSRMYQAYAEAEWDAEVRVFKSRSEAMEWLSDKSI